MDSPQKDPLILVYDIETTPCLAWVWRCGDQVVRHGQLFDGLDETKIICITYRWMHEKKAKALTSKIKPFDVDDRAVLHEFHKLATKADIIIGKNNNRFDDKHINYRLFAEGLPPIADLARKSDDLEKQMRRHFNMQSYALDFFAKKELGEGKDKMEFNDWVQIVQHASQKHLKKMVKYGLKDADQTAELITRVWPHVKPKYNMAAHYGDFSCTHCGSQRLRKNGTRVVGSVRKQAMYCKDHHGHAGYATIKKDGTLGRMTK